MAIYSGNDDFLSIDGVELNDLWRSIKIIPKVQSRDVTSGRSPYRQRVSTLHDFVLEMTIIYMLGEAGVILPLIAPGEHLVCYGPEGNSAGKPRHQQIFIFDEVDTEANHDKSNARTFTISAEAADAPDFNMFKGDTF